MPQSEAVPGAQQTDLGWVTNLFLKGQLGARRALSHAGVIHPEGLTPFSFVMNEWGLIVVSSPPVLLNKHVTPFCPAEF